MKFIGQDHITRQLDFILPDLRENRAKGCAILLRGPSGFGKTTMAHEICRDISGSNYQIFLGENHAFRFVKRVVFIDEIHTVANLERFYHVLDESRHVMVFATNKDATLPEAFTNRCYQFVFTDYTQDELVTISRGGSKFYATDEQHLCIVKAGNENPRVIKSLCKRLGIFFQRNPGIYSTELDFSELILEIFQIKDGMDTLCRRYVQILKELGGTASIDRLCGALHVDSFTLKNDIEPILIRKNIIQISSKGRKLL